MARWPDDQVGSRPIELTKLRWRVAIDDGLPWYIRGAVTTTSGSKRAPLVLAEAAAMAAGLSLLGDDIGQRRVLFHSSDETESEIARRVRAITRRYDLPSGGGPIISTGRLLGVKSLIAEHQLDCIIVDHPLAQETSCAIHVVTPHAHGDRMVAKVSRAEARAAGIRDAERSQHFKAGAALYRMESVDGIDVAVPHERPAFCFVHRDSVLASLAMTDSGPWRADLRSPDWLGHIVAKELGLEAANPIIAGQIETLISDWVKQGVVVQYTDQDANSMSRTFLKLSE
jgi:hypothetical protein